jgi:hypothetical protein
MFHQATLARECVRGVTLLHDGSLRTPHNIVFSRGEVNDPRQAHFSQEVSRRGNLPRRANPPLRWRAKPGSDNGLTARLLKEARLIGTHRSSARQEEDLASNETCSPQPGGNP